MPLALPWRVWVERVLRLGPSRLGLGLAILLALVALALPFWSLGLAEGTDRDIASFGWTSVTTDHYSNGVWDGTTILPYASSQPALAQFSFRLVGGALGTAYVLDLVFLIVAAVIFALFSMDFARTMPALSLLVISLLVVGVGLLALFYPIVTVAGAATTDVGTFTVSGFWGSTRTSGLTRDWSWGPGLGWWLLLVAVLSGIIGAALPYLKSIRAMGPLRPRAQRPSM